VPQRQSAHHIAAETGFDSWEERIWQFRQNGMTRAGVRDGYQVYVDTIQAQGARPELTTFYFRRTNSEGKLRCLVICTSGSCQRQILIGHHILGYRLQESSFIEWDELEQRLAALVNAWAAP
jgi:hypothetical protein